MKNAAVPKLFNDNGKEGCVRETQEGCPSPFKSSLLKLFQSFNNVGSVA